MPLLRNASFKEFGSLVCLWQDVKLRKTQLEVGSLNATWSRDLWVIVFSEMCQIVGWTTMANLAALRAAVFSLSAKNRTGGVEINPPPVRGLTSHPQSYMTEIGFSSIVRLRLRAFGAQHPSELVMACLAWFSRGQCPLPFLLIVYLLN